MIQITILKIIGYGPWTLTLGSDREHELQMLQASLYKQLQALFSQKNGLVFLNRADEFFIVTNGIDLSNHLEIQKKLESDFDIRLSMSIGYGKTPFDANLKAYKGKESNIFLDEEYNIYGYISEKSQDHNVTIMHLDVDDLTSTRKQNSPYEISVIIFDLYAKMSKFFLDKQSLSFFMGGDNFMVIADKQAKDSVKEFLDSTRRDDIIINCGIGNANTAREAAKLATKSLDTIRQIRDEGKEEKPEIYELSCS
jgi:GTP cyclohydrolase IIa